MSDRVRVEWDDPLPWDVMEGEFAAAEAVLAYERANVGAVLWWVVLIDRSTKPSGIMAASIHDDPMPRLRALWAGLYRQRSAKTAAWRIVVAPVSFEASEDELAVVLTLPRDRPMVVMERDAEMPPLHEEYVLTDAERAVLVNVVPHDLARPRPYVRGLLGAGS